MPTNPYAPASVDFSALANLPDQYAAGQQFARQQQLRNAFAGGSGQGTGRNDGLELGYRSACGI